MIVAKDIFKGVLAVNLIVYALFVFAEMSGFLSRTIWNRCGAVVAACMAVSLCFSVAFLFVDRRLASRGFLVVLLGFIIWLLSPQL